MQQDAQETGEARPVLVVDLDGTLVRTDLLHESFWSAFARHWWAPAAAALALLRAGRPGLKRRLAALGPVEMATLPYNPDLLQRLRDWRAAGGRTALVTAADADLAARIAAHLGSFDEVHGSTPGQNLKGRAKAAFLRQRFGSEGHVYAGDSPADLPVWEGAAAALTVTPSARLRAEVEARMAPSGRPVEHLPAPSPTAADWLAAAGPRRWPPHALALLPALAAPAALAPAALAVLALTLATTAAQLLATLRRVEADRARTAPNPFADGSLPLPRGVPLVVALLLAAVLAALPLGAAVLATVAAQAALGLARPASRALHSVTRAARWTLCLLAGLLATATPLTWLPAAALVLLAAAALLPRSAP